LILRVTPSEPRGWTRIVWSWSDVVERVRLDRWSSVTDIYHRDGTIDRHRRSMSGWSVERRVGSVRTITELRGVVRGPRPRITPSVELSAPEHHIDLGRPNHFELGQEQYRRSEETWEEAGMPSARIGILALPNELVVDVAVHKRGDFTFVPGDARNAYDNESPDINGDGVQLYISNAYGTSAWVLVPEVTEAEEGSVRARLIEDWETPRPLRAAWRVTEDGYTLRVRIQDSPPEAESREFALGVVINEKPTGRERRRGQLVLGGKPGQFVYLRGDREDRSELLRFAVR
jgi:hypothetical protein